MINARFLNLKPLFPCTLSGENSPYALINQCFIVIKQTLIGAVSTMEQRDFVIVSKKRAIANHTPLPIFFIITF